MKKVFWTSLVVAFYLTSCGTSKITDSWKTDNETAIFYNKIMVLSLSSNPDLNARGKMEDHMVGDLQDLGYNAVSSLRQYGSKFFEYMDEETALTKIRDNGIDAVITIVMLDKEKEKRYIPIDMDYPTYEYDFDQYRNEFDPFWKYQSAFYNRIYESRDDVINIKYFWESNLYNMRNQKLIYSARTESFDPANSESLGHEYGKLIIKDMVRQKVLYDKK